MVLAVFGGFGLYLVVFLRLVAGLLWILFLDRFAWLLVIFGIASLVYLGFLGCVGFCGVGIIYVLFTFLGFRGILLVCLVRFGDLGFAFLGLISARILVLIVGGGGLFWQFGLYLVVFLSLLWVWCGLFSWWVCVGCG